MTTVPTLASDRDQVLENLLSTAVDQERNIHFATAGYNIPLYAETVASIQAQEMDAKSKRLQLREYTNSVRRAEYIVGRKCIYVDIDKVDLSDDAYTNGVDKYGCKVFDNEVAIVAALNEAIVTYDIPVPTYITLSGGGLHLYWALEETISQEKWRFLQLQINQILYAVAQIAVDRQVARNPNGTIRVPTSFNYKRGVYSKLKKIGTLHAYDTLKAKLDSLVPTDALDQVVAGAPSFLQILLSKPIPHDMPSFDIPLSAWGYTDLVEPKWEYVVSKDKGCNFARTASTTGAATLGGNDWFYLLTLAAHCADGANLIHTVSKAHPAYTEEETNTRGLGALSVTSCATIASVIKGKVHNPACADCKYLDPKTKKPLLKNPLEISRRIQMTEELAVPQPDTPLFVVNTHPVEAESVAVPVMQVSLDAPLELDASMLKSSVVQEFMPDSYFILDPEVLKSYKLDALPAGIGYKVPDPEIEGVYSVTRVTTSFIYIIDVIRDGKTNSIQYDFAVQQADNKLATVRLTATELASDEELIKRFADVGVMFHLESTRYKKVRLPLFLDYIRQSVAKRMAMGKYTSNIKQFGWTSDKKNFVLGGWLLNAKAPERVHPSAACSTYLDALTPIPTARISAWSKASKVYAHEGMEAAQFIMGVSLASPVLGLLGTADSQGALINIFSTASGLGKTTLAHSALSIWGRASPMSSQAGLSGISNDTQKSRIFNMSIMQNVPFYMDETTDMTAKQAYQLVYQITQGQDARRMKQSGVEAHDTIGGWNMVAMTSSNKSIVEKLYSEAGASGDAVHARVLEIDMLKLRSAREFHSHADIQSAFRIMQVENYGIIGQNYMMRVLHDVDGTIQMFHDIREELDRIFKFQTHERFWANTAVLGIMGLRQGNAYEYFDYDESAVIAWLKDLLEATRFERIESQVPMEQMIAEFISDRYSDSIIASNSKTVMWASGRVANEVSYRDNRYEASYKLHRFHFTEFVTERYGWSAKEVIKRMTMLCGKSQRIRFLSGLVQVDENTPMQIDGWSVPYNLINIGNTK